MYQALYRKYRPLRFADVVGQNAVTKTLIGQLQGDKIGHAYLFTGTRGTGKTTCAKILARAVNCEHPVNGDPCNECPSCKGILDGSVTDVFEIDAASNNSVDNVRELREDVVYTPALVKYKVYIIDEVHRMSGPAFDALLKTIEEPPAHVIFILATTELHKVPATILSRCQRFDFRRIDAPDIGARLKYVAEQEGIALSDEAAALLGRMGQGSMRDALSLLERATALQGQVDAAAVGELLGLCDPARLVEAVEHIADHNIAGVLRFLNDMWRDSKDITRLLNEMAVLLRDIALSDVAPELVAANRSEEELVRLQALQGKMTKAGVLNAMETLQKGLRDIAQSADQRVMTEITLMRMCDPRLDTSGGALVTRMERLEKAYATLMRGGKLPAQKTAAPQRPIHTPPSARTAPAVPPQPHDAPAAGEGNNVARMDVPPKPWTNAETAVSTQPHDMPAAGEGNNVARMDVPTAPWTNEAPAVPPQPHDAPAAGEGNNVARMDVPSEPWTNEAPAVPPQPHDAPAAGEGNNVARTNVPPKPWTNEAPAVPPQPHDAPAAGEGDADIARMDVPTAPWTSAETVVPPQSHDAPAAGEGNGVARMDVPPESWTNAETAVSTQPHDAPAAGARERLWQDTLEILRVGGRDDLLVTLEDNPAPEFAGSKVIFRLEKDSFARRHLSSDKFKAALLSALEKADGKPHTITFAEPIPAPKEHDALDDLIETLGEDAVIED